MKYMSRLNADLGGRQVRPITLCSADEAAVALEDGVIDQPLAIVRKPESLEQEQKVSYIM